MSKLPEMRAAVVVRLESDLDSNRKQVERMCREHVTLWADAGSQLIGLLRYLHDVEEGTEVLRRREEPASDEDVQLPPYEAEWRRLRRRAIAGSEQNLATARKAIRHIEMLFEQSERAGDLPALRAAAGWSSREGNAATLEALAQR